MEHDDQSTHVPYTVEPGVRSTEFWLSLAVIVAASVMLVLDRIDATTWTVAVGVGSGAYSVSRGLAKL